MKDIKEFITERGPAPELRKDIKIYIDDYALKISNEVLV